MKRIAVAVLLAGGLCALLFRFPVGAQNSPRTYLPLVAREAFPASWSRTPTSTPPPLLPSPTAGPSPTATPAPADVRIVSTSAFTQTLGAETFLFIVGEVGNAGPSTVRDISVIAALLNGKGELIEHANEPAYQTVLEPGETTPFRIMVSLPTGYVTHILYLDFRLTAEARPPVVSPSATNIYVDENSGWQYFLGEVVNTTDVDMADVQAVVTLYDEFGDVLNVVDSGHGANSLYEDVIGVGQKRPFRVVLRYGPGGYASLRWQIAYRVADRPAPASLPLHVGYVARSSGTLRDESGEIVGVTQWFDIYGEVENTTQGPIRAVRAYAAFYADSGEVMNAGLVQSLHGRLGTLAPGEWTPFHLNVSSGPIPDVDTPRFLGVTYEPAAGGGQPPLTITSRRAYRETRSVMGMPVDWLNVVGEVRNACTEPCQSDGVENVRGVRVIATFYDEAERVVNAVTGEVFRPVLAAGMASPFKIRTASGPLSYDHFALDVVALPSSAGAASDLVLDAQPPTPGSMPAIFRGEVTNASDETASGVTVFVALYDAEGQILVAESQLVAEAVPAGASVPFTLRVEYGTDGWQTYDIGIVSRRN